MKTLLVTTLLTIAAPAFADDTNTPHAYWCTADGYDHENRLRSISGDLEPTRERAQQSALRLCRQLFMACRLGSCFQQR